LPAFHPGAVVVVALADPDHCAGDSGGPVWTRYGLDELAIVGIWLGTHDDVDTINGRFYPLPEALQKLGLAANPL